MVKEKYKNKYDKRPSVEWPFGILKEHFYVGQEIVIEMIKI